MNRTHRPHPSPHPLRRPRRTAGLTVGAILGALAVVAVLVVILLLVWRPGAAPPAPDPQPEGPPAIEEDVEPTEADDAAAFEEPGAGAVDEADEADAGEADDAAAAEGAEDGAGAPAGEDAPPEEEQAPAGDAEPASEQPPVEEDAPAEGAPADGDEAAAPEAEAEPLDARVAIEEDEPVRTDPMQRTADLGGALAQASERTAAAIEATEERLARLDPFEPTAEGEAVAIGDGGMASADATEGRVRRVETPAASVGDRTRELEAVTADSQRTERQQSSPAIQLTESGSDGADEEFARVRTVSIDRPAQVPDSPRTVSRTERPTGGDGARVDLSMPAAPRESPRVRTVTTQRTGPRALEGSDGRANVTSPADEDREARVDLAGQADTPDQEVRALHLDTNVESLREAVQRAQQSARDTLEVEAAPPTDDTP